MTLTNVARKVLNTKVKRNVLLRIILIFQDFIKICSNTQELKRIKKILFKLYKRKKD